MSNAQSQMKVYAVIAGADYEGEDFNTLRLFDCLSSAEAYGKELEQELCVDYVTIEEREVCFESVIAA
jgi:hypothetical protein